MKLPAGTERLNVLIVEDNSHTRRLLRGLLLRLGFSIITEADSVTAAIARIRARAPDLVVTDWDMPGNTGFDLLTWVRRSPHSPAPALPVILLTAHGDHDKVMLSRDGGATDFLVKPISPKNIIEHIQDVLQRRPDFIIAPDYVGPDRRRIRRSVGNERRAPTVPPGVTVLPDDGLIAAGMAADGEAVAEALQRREALQAHIAARAASRPDDLPSAQATYLLAAEALTGLDAAVSALARMRQPLRDWSESGTALARSAGDVLKSLHELPTLQGSSASELDLIRLHLLALRAIIRSVEEPAAAATATALAARIDAYRRRGDS